MTSDLLSDVTNAGDEGVYTLVRARKARHKLKIEEVQGDVMTSSAAYTMAHCISADVAMSAGVAKTFVERFPGLQEAICKQKRSIGDVAVVCLKPVDNSGDRVICNLVTKWQYHHKPTYGTLKCSLQAMRRHCTKNGVKKIAMPRIGCGLDQLHWPTVKKIIYDVFSGHSSSVLKVKIYNFKEVTREFYIDSILTNYSK